ncbi:mammaglobin-A-like [Pipistrellus kuhlii]|uniref:mammaglobin-A-like n=1 Tax=Pipistrellus kuhlii TaxID=59472 RepID=UPI00174EFA04|nr:mammaglobin-A-like [Pipistrellus kuhlii]
MKLVIVLMLTALPLFCYAGSGCQDIEYVIEKTIDPNESENQFIQDLEEYIPGGITEMALREFKQCFLNQNDETLNNFGVLVETIYKSEQYAGY